MHCQLASRLDQQRLSTLLTQNLHVITKSLKASPDLQPPLSALENPNQLFCKANDDLNEMLSIISTNLIYWQQLFDKSRLKGLVDASRYKLNFFLALSNHTLSSIIVDLIIVASKCVSELVDCHKSLICLEIVCPEQNFIAQYLEKKNSSKSKMLKMIMECKQAKLIDNSTSRRLLSICFSKDLDSFDFFLHMSYIVKLSINDIFDVLNLICTKIFPISNDSGDMKPDICELDIHFLKFVSSVSNLLITIINDNNLHDKTDQHHPSDIYEEFITHLLDYPYQSNLNPEVPNSGLILKIASIVVILHQNNLLNLKSNQSMLSKLMPKLVSYDTDNSVIVEQIYLALILISETCELSQRSALIADFLERIQKIFQSAVAAASCDSQPQESLSQLITTNSLLGKILKCDAALLNVEFRNKFLFNSNKLFMNIESLSAFSDFLLQSTPQFTIYWIESQRFLVDALCRMDSSLWMIKNHQELVCHWLIDLLQLARRNPKFNLNVSHLVYILMSNWRVLSDQSIILLINCFGESLLMLRDDEKLPFQTPISADVITELFDYWPSFMSVDCGSGSDHRDLLLSRILALYYLCFYWNTYYKFVKTSNIKRDSPYYSESLLSSIPLKYLIYQLSFDPLLSRKFEPSMIGCMLSQLPQLETISHWTCSINVNSAPLVTNKSRMVTGNTHSKSKKLKEVLRMISAKLESLQMLSKNECETFENLLSDQHSTLFYLMLGNQVVNLISKLISGELYLMHYQSEFLQFLVLKIEHLVQRQFYAEILLKISEICNLFPFLPRDNSNARHQIFMEFIKVPKTLLSNLGNIKKPMIVPLQILALLLRISEFLYCLSERHFRNIHLVNSHLNSEDEQVNALVQSKLHNASQYKCFLDLANLAKLYREEIKNINFDPLSELLIYDAIHRLFLKSPQMMQMIHTIGYDVAHLQYLVQNVPSIHICINFAIDILLKVPCDKKVFAVKLISNLATTYKLESSLNLCQMTLTILNNVFATMNESMRFKIFSQIIPDIFTICEAFPVLNIAVMRLLERLLSFCSDYSTSCTKSDQSALKKRIEAAKKSILKHKHTIQHNSAPLISLQ